MARRFQTKRSFLPTLLLAAAIMATHIGAAHAQQAPPTNFVAPEDLTLRTITPLGEAKVAIPKGTVLTNFEVQGGQVKIWRGPFSAVVDLAVLQPAAPADAPSPPPATAPAPPAPEPTPEPEATPVPTPVAEPPVNETALSSLPPWVLPAACGALGLYALFSTIAWRRARRPSASAPTKNADSTPQTPVVVIPKNAKATPAVVSDGGRAIACPLCGANIALEKLSAGRNTCPSCRQGFVCE